MKFSLFINKDREEEVIVYAHKCTDTVLKIRSLVEEPSHNLVGYTDTDKVIIKLNEVYCFVVSSNKVYAVTKSDKLKLKLRLYQLEEFLPYNFIKINQSCIANKDHIAKFSASMSTTLKVIFKNGYEEYVSRRQLKSVKERMGL